MFYSVKEIGLLKTYLVLRWATVSTYNLSGPMYNVFFFFRFVPPYQPPYAFNGLLQGLILDKRGSGSCTGVSKESIQFESKCDWIYGNRSKSHIGSYEIIDFKDFNTL